MTQLLRKLRYRAARTKLRAPLVWYLHKGLTPDDVFIASFPRSGSHWLTFLLIQILTGIPAEFDTRYHAVPKVGNHRRAPALLGGVSRLIQTHEPYRAEYRKAVYLVRDVRDVALSNYAFEKGLGYISYYGFRGFDEYLGAFLRGKTVRYGSWQAHVESWLQSPLVKQQSLLLVRFEDLRKGPEGALAGILRFLRADVDVEAIREAIASNSLANMRAKEDRSVTYRMLPKAPGENGGRYIRTGATGQWQAELTDAQLELVEAYAGGALARLGYSPGITRQPWTPAEHSSDLPPTAVRP